MRRSYELTLLPLLVVMAGLVVTTACRPKSADNQTSSTSSICEKIVADQDAMYEATKTLDSGIATGCTPIMCEGNKLGSAECGFLDDVTKCISICTEPGDSLLNRKMVCSNNLSSGCYQIPK